MKTREDILQIIEEEDVEFIRLQFVDMFGKIMEDGHCIMLFDVPNDFNGRPDILIY